MSTTLPFEHHFDALIREGQRFVELLGHAELDAPVPTCPEWTVRELAAHQGEVHRWATDTLTRAAAGDAGRSPQPVAAPPGGAIVDWLASGIAELVTALHRTDDHLVAPVFLKDPPPPRQFWARRQAHETAMHRTDALSAVLGRIPSAADVGLAPEFAADGIDELLTGFVPRSRTPLRADAPLRIAVAPTDLDRRWLVTVSSGPPVTTTARGPSDVAVDATFTGTAAELYLGVWNRGELTSTGDPAIAAQWRDQMRVQWA